VNSQPSSPLPAAHVPRASEVRDEYFGDAPLPAAFLAAIVASSDDAIVTKNLDGIILSWNRAAERIFGYRAEEVIGKPINVIIPAELFEEEREILARLRRGERVEHFETTRLHKGGSRLAISLSVSPVRDASGTIVAAAKIARDISEQKFTERLQGHWAAIVESTDDAIMGKTLGGIIQSWNPGATQLLGYQLEEVLGRPVEMLIPPELQPQERLIRERIQKGERIEHFDTVRIAKDGRRLIVSLTVSPVRDPSGTVIGASTIARDISQRKLQEEALREAQHALLEADARKDRFLAYLSHELRNPLAPIGYALEMLKSRPKDPEWHGRAVEIIGRQVRQLSALLDEMRDLATVKQGLIRLERQRCELQDLLNAAIEAVKPKIDEKRHTLTCALPPETIQVEADPVRMVQVFSNLLRNASKYTPAGGRIEIEVRTRPREVTVLVRDNGIGIAPEALPRIFELFGQAPEAMSRAEGGLGIGLALVKALVQLHDGSVEGYSAGPGLGAEFTVRLPRPF
jgi:PAS domain S-box-containing protein